MMNLKSHQYLQRWIKTGLLGLMGVVILSFSLFAATNDVGKVAAPFLQSNPSVRLMALGGDQVAARKGVDSFYSNPASLTSLQIPHLFFSHNQSFLDSTDQTIGFGLPWKDHGLAFSANYIDGGQVDRVDLNPNTNEPIFGLGQAQFSTLALQTALSRGIGERLDLGLSLKGWRESREFSSSTGWAADAGLQMRSLLPSLDVGLAAKNLGPSVDGFDLPTSLALARLITGNGRGQMFG